MLWNADGKKITSGKEITSFILLIQRNPTHETHRFQIIEMFFFWFYLRWLDFMDEFQPNKVFNCEKWCFYQVLGKLIICTLLIYDVLWYSEEDLNISLRLTHKWTNRNEGCWMFFECWLKGHHTFSSEHSIPMVHFCIWWWCKSFALWVKCFRAFVLSWFKLKEKKTSM